MEEDLLWTTALQALRDEQVMLWDALWHQGEATFQFRKSAPEWVSRVQPLVIFGVHSWLRLFSFLPTQLLTFLRPFQTHLLSITPLRKIHRVMTISFFLLSIVLT